MAEVEVSYDRVSIHGIYDVSSALKVDLAMRNVKIKESPR